MRRRNPPRRQGRWAGDQHPPPAVGIAGAGGVERAEDRNLRDRRPEPRMAIEIKVDVQRLPGRFQ